VPPFTVEHVSVPARLSPDGGEAEAVNDGLEDPYVCDPDTDTGTETGLTVNVDPV
jgi:hypothetical protein